MNRKLMLKTFVLEACISQFTLICLRITCGIIYTLWVNILDWKTLLM